ncbi:tyrosine-type recombinase/integrase [Corynebacterium heidelbergense]|uniref:Integrase n=1 Tax=Corynebacterium heidelbergense TaxID=2055947 RepID=A0A364VAD0_9CORY|nr:tyrosine-type recombinase/integrase [Corynebacterium heidelbergense]RAV33526.1 integrase [Corynebacterium heidelbergense]
MNESDLVAWLASQPWAPATRRSVRASLRTYWAWRARTGRGVNAAAELPRAAVPRAVPRPAADTVILSALRRAEPRVQTMIELMAYGGLRRCEVATVRGEDIAGHWLRVTGKGGHVRAVPLPPHLAARIAANPGWLFPGQIDGHLSARRVGELVGEVLPPGVTAHQLRHRYATTVYAASHDIRAVQRLLGHAKLDTTMIYTAVDDQVASSAAAGAWRLSS